MALATRTILVGGALFDRVSKRVSLSIKVLSWRRGVGHCMAIDRLGSYKSWGVSWEFVHRRKYDKLRGCIWPDQRRPAPAYASKWQALIRTQFTFPQLLICPTMARTIKPSVSANAESTAVCAINMPGHAPLGPIAKPISSSRLFFSG